MHIVVCQSRHCDGDEQSTCYVNMLSYIFRRKKESRLPHELSQKAKKLRGIKWVLLFCVTFRSWLLMCLF